MNNKRKLTIVAIAAAVIAVAVVVFAVAGTVTRLLTKKEEQGDA